MSIRILTVALRQPSDLVAARQRARQLAEALRFGQTEQTSILPLGRMIVFVVHCA